VQEGPECQQRRQRAKPNPSFIPAPMTGRGRGRDSGAEREQGDTTPHVPEKPGARWNEPEVIDNAQQLPSFSLLITPGLQGFMCVTYSPVQI